MLIEYLKRHIKVIGLLCAYGVIFSIVLYLYNIETPAIIYAFTLSAFFTIVFFMFGFVKFYKKHQLLLKMLSSNSTVVDENLPIPNDLIERDYQNIISALYADIQHKVTQFDFAQSQMNDYYTMWVHQIKTPISALGLLLETQQSGQNEQTLSMKSELFKIEQYVDMALNYVRLESETSDFRFERLDLYELIKASIRKYRTLFIEKGISLNLEPFEFTALTDAKWFAFCFEQVLSNALKYTHEGAIWIALSTNEGHPQLTLRDSGIGIQKDDLPRVFERGFTGYNGRQDRKSTGLGLYLCKRTLKKLSLEIWIESEPGEGTRVYIEFPLTKV